MLLRRVMEHVRHQDWERGVPVSVARIQGNLPIISRKWRAELVSTKKLLEARR